MNPDVIQFQCSACQHMLTVPSHLAGVSGPCPMCGTTVTSPSASPALVFGMNPMAAPAPIQQPSQMLGSMPPASPQGAVMPLPNIQQHTTGVLGGGVPMGGMQPALSQPIWQQPPGFGQTMLEAVAPSAQHSPGGFLPPARQDGQRPLTGGMPGAVDWNGAPQTAFPDASNQHRPGTAPGHSTLISGAPALSVNTSANDGFGGGLLARALPSIPLQPTSSTASLEANAPSNSEMRPPSDSFVPPNFSATRSLPLNKPKRASNIFMIGLASLLLVGALAIVGWLFREPLQVLVAKFTSSSEMVQESAPSLPVKSGEPSGLSITAKTDPVPREEPTEQPPKAERVTDEAVAKAMEEKKTDLPAKPIPVVEPKQPTDSTMVEVPAPAGTVPAKPNAATANVATTGTLETKAVHVEVPLEAEPAAEALKKFLGAQNMAERLSYTLAADAMKPIMERYYSVNLDGPILIDAIGLVTYHPKPQIGGGAHAIFGVESKTWEFPVPVMLEDVGGSFKVDWLSFVEFKDRLLEKFLLTYQEGTARFHVGITRTHYFEDKVPNSAGKEAFRISPAPPNPFMATVFVEKDSTMGRDLRDKIPWGAQVYAIVELEWTKLGNQAWVELKGVPQLNWYSVPTAPKAVRATPPSSSSIEVPTETQRAVPIGR